MPLPFSFQEWMRKSAFGGTCSQSLLVFSLLALILVGSSKFSCATPVFRIGFSRQTIGAINENDAMAAVKIWAQAFANEQNIIADPVPKIFENMDEASLSLRAGKVDCINVTTEEYLALKDYIDQDSIITAAKAGDISEEYLVLVHKDSDIRSIEDLRGSRLNFIQSSRTSCANLA